MALLQLVLLEVGTLAPGLWLRTRALEAWLNDKARQGWSLAAMDDADVMLKEDGGGRRYRVVAHAEAGLAAFLERCETEGWRLAGSGEDGYILEDAAGTAKSVCCPFPRGARVTPSRCIWAALYPWTALCAEARSW